MVCCEKLFVQRKVKVKNPYGIRNLHMKYGSLYYELMWNASGNKGNLLSDFLSSLALPKPNYTYMGTGG